MWGQDLKTFEILLYRFSGPGARILDPFVGGGTTAAACVTQQRKFVGFDNDPEAVATTLNRLASMDPNAPKGIPPEVRMNVSDILDADSTGRATAQP